MTIEKSVVYFVDDILAVSLRLCCSCPSWIPHRRSEMMLHLLPSFGSRATIVNTIAGNVRVRGEIQEQSVLVERSAGCRGPQTRVRGRPRRRELAQGAGQQLQHVRRLAPSRDTHYTQGYK
eukprot:6173584-Pleurochrysis_carterae.AAC.3